MRKPETDMDATAPGEFESKNDFRSYCLMKYGSESAALAALVENRAEQLLALGECVEWSKPKH